MLHVCSWSGGKDSTATCILMHKHREEILNPGDKVVVVFSEVMFDKKKNISGHNPEIIDFIHKTKDIFISWGFEVEILHSDKDFLDVFYHKLTRSPDPNRVGLTHGFVPSGMCAVKRDCKLKPIKDWNKKHENEDMIQYVGIAIDEQDRLESLHKQPNTVSLLEKYSLTEKDAMALCREYGLVSPQYFLNGGRQSRDGCWFCPNAKLCEHQAIYRANPKAWKKYVSLEDTENLAYPKWNPYTKQTLHERDELVRNGYYQMSIFDLVS